MKIFLCDDEEKVILELAKRGLQTEPKPKKKAGRPSFYPRFEQPVIKEVPSNSCHSSKKLSEEIQ